MSQVKAIAASAVELRSLRRRIMTENNLSLRELYRVVEETPANQVGEAQDRLDALNSSPYAPLNQRSLIKDSPNSFWRHL